jgi:hypothetical protein
VAPDQRLRLLDPWSLPCNSESVRGLTYFSIGKIMKISIESIVNSDIATAWSAWTTPADINQWNAASADWQKRKGRQNILDRFASYVESKNTI